MTSRYRRNAWTRGLHKGKKLRKGRHGLLQVFYACAKGTTNVTENVFPREIGAQRAWLGRGRIFSKPSTPRCAMKLLYSQYLKANIRQNKTSTSRYETSPTRLYTLATTAANPPRCAKQKQKRTNPAASEQKHHPNSFSARQIIDPSFLTLNTPSNSMSTRPVLLHYESRLASSLSHQLQHRLSLPRQTCIGEFLHPLQVKRSAVPASLNYFSTETNTLSACTYSRHHSDIWATPAKTSPRVCAHSQTEQKKTN